MMSQTSSISRCRSGSWPSMMALRPDRSIEADESIGASTIASVTPVRLAQVAQAPQRRRAPARGAVPVLGIPADVIDAVALEVLQPAGVRGRALAPDDHRGSSGAPAVGWAATSPGAAERRRARHARGRDEVPTLHGATAYTRIVPDRIGQCHPTRGRDWAPAGPTTRAHDPSTNMARRRLVMDTQRRVLAVVTGVGCGNPGLLRTRFVPTCRGPAESAATAWCRSRSSCSGLPLDGSVRGTARRTCPRCAPLPCRKTAACNPRRACWETALSTDSSWTRPPPWCASRT